MAQETEERMENKAKLAIQTKRWTKLCYKRIAEQQDRLNNCRQLRPSIVITRDQYKPCCDKQINECKRKSKRNNVIRYHRSTQHLLEPNDNR